MNEPIPDDDLKTLYARQRAANEERMPRFQAMRARALEDRSTAQSGKPAIPRWTWPLTAAAPVLRAMVAFLVAPHPPDPSRQTSRDEMVRQIARIDAELHKNLAAQQSI